MIKTRTAKLFKNGSSQAVRLPAEFRFRGSEVFASRDEFTGDVVLSSNPSKTTWQDFFALSQDQEESPEFMADRPMNSLPREHGIFDDLNARSKKKRAS